jgi:uncharacterized protein YcbK (DUF882 family)
MEISTLARAAALGAALATAGAAVPADARGSGKPSLKERTVLSYAHKSANALTVSPGAMKGLNPRLRGLLGTIQKRFGKPVQITSGCRSRTGNRRAGGARGSLHLSCMAADIRVQGVSQRALLAVAKTLPGRGGVGTYCGKSIVHVDVGPRRDWHFGCGGKRRKRG